MTAGGGFGALDEETKARIQALEPSYEGKGYADLLQESRGLVAGGDAWRAIMNVMARHPDNPVRRSG